MITINRSLPMIERRRNTQHAGLAEHLSRRSDSQAGFCRIPGQESHWGKRKDLNYAGYYRERVFVHWRIPDWDESKLQSIICTRYGLMIGCCCALPSLEQSQIVEHSPKVFIAPSPPIRVDQEGDAHTTRAPAFFSEVVPQIPVTKSALFAMNPLCG